jgi:hypothetical protein
VRYGLLTIAKKKERSGCVYPIDAESQWADAIPVEACFRCFHCPDRIASACCHSHYDSLTNHSLESGASCCHFLPVIVETSSEIALRHGYLQGRCPCAKIFQYPWTWNQARWILCVRYQFLRRSVLQEIQNGSNRYGWKKRNQIQPVYFRQPTGLNPVVRTSRWLMLRQFGELQHCRAY